MSIGADVKEVLQEVGTPFTAYHYDGSTVTDEKLDIETYPSHSSEFIRQFFAYATLFYDTQVVPGDVLEITPTSTRYLVTIVLPEFFEGEAVESGLSLLRVNITGKVQREGARVRDAQYKLTNTFGDIYSNVPGLLLDDFLRSYTDQEGLFTTEELRKGVLIQSGYTVLVGDRFWVSDNEYYKIELLQTNRYEGLTVCYLSEDTR